MASESALTPEKILAFIQQRADRYQEYLNEPSGTYEADELQSFKDKMHEAWDTIGDIKRAFPELSAAHGT